MRQEFMRQELTSFSADMEKYLELLKNGGCDAALVIAAQSVITAPWTIYKCQYGCPRYGTSHCCPPKSPSWKATQEMLSCFQYGILFRCHEMKTGTALAMQAAKELLLDGYYKVIAFGCGPCSKCETCAPERCRFPGQTIPSMEACGIDVFATVQGNGLEIQMLRDKDAPINCYGLILVE